MPAPGVSAVQLPHTPPAPHAHPLKLPAAGTQRIYVNSRRGGTRTRTAAVFAPLYYLSQRRAEAANAAVLSRTAQPGLSYVENDGPRGQIKERPSGRINKDVSVLPKGSEAESHAAPVPQSVPRRQAYFSYDVPDPFLYTACTAAGFIGI